MQHRALIVDDDASIRRIVRSVLDSLGHKYAEASSQESARKILARGGFTYALLDLEIPEKDSRGIPRIPNGLNLLEEIVANAETANLPVIVMTAHGTEKPHLAVECLTTGAANWINKPFPVTDRTLDKVIKQTLSKRPARSNPLPKPATEERKAFAGGELVFYPDRVELSGVKVAGAQGMTHIRQILDALKKKNSTGRHVAFSGEELAEMVSAEGQNSISSTIGEFREKVVDLLRKNAGLECGEYGVIENAGGYRFAAGIVVVDGAPGKDAPEAIVPPTGKGHTAQSRQDWIVDQLKRGTLLRVADIVKAFGCSNRTAIRDTGELKKKGLVQYHGDAKDGYYTLSQ